MPRGIIIGARGFIGSALVAEATRRGWDVVAVDRANYSSCRGTDADWLIYAGGNSRKYLDERDPAEGFARSVTDVLRVLLDFAPRRFIFLSSGAVYLREDDPAHNRENAILAPESPTRYGFHKWLAENLVRRYAADHLILRLGGCVGPGLNKNAIYDLLAGERWHVHPDSQFQYLDTRDLAGTLFQLHECDLPSGTVLNLSARGVVSIRQAAEWAGVTPPTAAEQLPKHRCELNVERAHALLSLPETAGVVQNFIREVRAGTIQLGQRPTS